MSSNDPPVETLLEQASGIVAASQGKVGVAKAMELVGFSSGDRKNITLYQKVRRRAGKLSVVEKKTPPIPAEEVNLRDSASQVSALTSDEQNSRRRSRSTERSSRAVRRRILNDAAAPERGEGNENNSSDPADSATANSGKSSEESNKSKRSRSTSKELQRRNAMVIMQTQ